MTDLAPSKNIMQVEECQFRMPVSENLITKISSNINYLFEKTYFSGTITAGALSPGTDVAIPFVTLLDTDLGFDGYNYTIPSTGNYFIMARVNSESRGVQAEMLATTNIYKNTSFLLASDTNQSLLSQALIYGRTIDCTNTPIYFGPLTALDVISVKITTWYGTGLLGGNLVIVKVS